MPIRWVSAGDFSPRPGPLKNGAKHYSDRTPERAQNRAPDSLVTPRINDLEGCQQAGARQGDSGGQSMEEEEVVGEGGERIEEEGEFAALSRVEAGLRHLTGYDEDSPPASLPP
ncbi:unnamed protein product [Lota lota]